MARPSMIKLEKTADGAEARCAECDWFSFRFTMSDAHKSASAHEQRAHPGDYRARNAAKMYERRHAAAPVNV